MKNECPECGHQWESELPEPAVCSNNIGELLKLVIDEKLNDFEAEFIASLRPRFAKYGDNTRMTDKQMTVLRKIAAK